MSNPCFVVNGNKVSFLVDGNSVIFNVSGVGPPGPPGKPFAALDTITESVTATAGESGTIFLNEGATAEVDVSLPPAPNPIFPLTFSLYVAAAHNFSFIAPAGVTIANGTNSSTAGGSISSNAVGNFVTVALISPTLWIITAIVGIWDLE